MTDFRHQQFSILLTIHMMQSWYFDSNYTIPVLPRMCRSDIHQADATPGIRRFRYGQVVPDRPNSLLFYKEKESAMLSQFNAYQLPIPAVQVRLQCWLILGLPGVRGGCTTTLLCPVPGSSVQEGHKHTRECPAKDHKRCWRDWSISPMRKGWKSWACQSGKAR